MTPVNGAWYHFYGSIDYANHNYFLNFYQPALEDAVNFNSAEWTITNSGWFFNGNNTIPYPGTYVFIGGVNYGANGGINGFCGQTVELTLIPNFYLATGFENYFRNGFARKNLNFSCVPYKKIFMVMWQQILNIILMTI